MFQTDILKMNPCSRVLFYFVCPCNAVINYLFISNVNNCLCVLFNCPLGINKVLLNWIELNWLSCLLILWLTFPLFENSCYRPVQSWFLLYLYIWAAILLTCESVLFIYQTLYSTSCISPLSPLSCYWLSRTELLSLWHLNIWNFFTCYFFS